MSANAPAALVRETMYVLFESWIIPELPAQPEIKKMMPNIAYRK
jgi:hypothetical protein